MWVSSTGLVWYLNAMLSFSIWCETGPIDLKSRPLSSCEEVSVKCEAWGIVRSLDKMICACGWATLLNFAGDKDVATQKFSRQMFIVQTYAEDFGNYQNLQSINRWSTTDQKKTKTLSCHLVWRQTLEVYLCFLNAAEKRKRKLNYKIHFKKWKVIRTVVYLDVSTFSFGFLLHEFLFLGSRVITILYEKETAATPRIRPKLSHSCWTEMCSVVPILMKA